MTSSADLKSVVSSKGGRHIRAQFIPALKGWGFLEICYKVASKQIIGRQLIENDRFIERVYFDDDFDIPSYFAKVKENPKAWKISRMYEDTFGAKDIELRILLPPK